MSPGSLQKERNWGQGQRQGRLSTKPVTSAPLSIGASEGTLPHGLWIDYVSPYGYLEHVK